MGDSDTSIHLGNQSTSDVEHAGAPPFTASIALDGSGVATGSIASGASLGERIRMPLAGEVVLVLSNPEGTPLHTFRVPYDFHALLPTHSGAPAVRAYLRQRVMAVQKGAGGGAVSSGTARYVVQLRFMSPAVRGGHQHTGASKRNRDGGGASKLPPRSPDVIGQTVEGITAAEDTARSKHGDDDGSPAATRRLYLQGDVRVVFTLRRSDDDRSTQLRAETEPPVLEAIPVAGAYAMSV